nr:hypothetical protein B11C_70003 [Bartonella sp. 1-1C]
MILKLKKSIVFFLKLYTIAYMVKIVGLNSNGHRGKIRN